MKSQDEVIFLSRCFRSSVKARHLANSAEQHSANFDALFGGIYPKIYDDNKKREETGNITEKQLLNKISLSLICQVESVVGKAP
jgi:hypothetical protein